VVDTEKHHDGVFRVRWCLSCGGSFQTSEALFARNEQIKRYNVPNKQADPPEIPERWPDCRFYDRCLTRAARVDAVLSCADCGRYEAAKFDREAALRDFDGCAALLYAIFNEEPMGV
jgi:hypothetical protein